MSQTLKFLMGREHKGQVNSNNSCYFKKDGTMFLINCGKGVLDAMKRTKALKGVKDVYVAITNSDKAHLADLKKFFVLLKTAKIMPKLIDSISLNKKLIKKMGIIDGEDCQVLEPLSNNVKWINFLATPHKGKDFSCPIELYLDGKKIFYGGDAGIIPFRISGYDEYYFDFADKKSEYAMSPQKLKSLVKKNNIKQSQLWLVHLENVAALKTAQKIGVRVAVEEQEKLAKVEKKATRQTEMHR